MASITTDPSAQTPHESLSERELQLLVHFGLRKAVAEVAADLNLSARTVSTYRTVLLRKLDLKSNSEMVHYALRQKLID